MSKGRIEMDNQKYDYRTLETIHHVEPPRPNRESQPGLEPAEWTYTQSIPQVRYDEPNYPEVIHLEEDTRKATAPSSPEYPPREERRICGLRRRLFFFGLAIVVLIVVGAVVGGICGALLSKSQSSDTPEDLSISRTSKLSSIHWKDADGVRFRAVFYQDDSGDLLFSLWDTQKKSWEVTNISKNMLDPSISIKALNGTPLAAVVRQQPSFGISLFFLSTDNVVESLSTTYPRGQSWSFGVLTNHHGQRGNYQAGEGSQLAAWWALCEKDCSGDVILLFEDAKQNLRMANSSDWTNEPKIIQPTIVAGSGLAMDGLVPDYGKSGNSSSSPRAYYDTSNTLQETLWEYGDPEWSNSASLGQALPSEPPLLAAMAFANATDLAAGALSLLVVSCFANGTLGANLFNNATWTPTVQPSLDGPDGANFTAVSLDAGKNMRFYGQTRNGSIWEYAVDREDPLHWSYSGTVPTQ